MHNMIVFKWLVDVELAKNSSFHFELISTFVASRDCEIGMKMLIEIEILAFRKKKNYWSIGFMLKRYFNLHLLQFPKELLK